MPLVEESLESEHGVMMKGVVMEGVVMATGIGECYTRMESINTY
jgi:hypothetical protein